MKNFKGRLEIIRIICQIISSMTVTIYYLDKIF